MYMTDSPRRFTDAAPAKKQLVATYHGSAYSAEREDGELNIYLTSVEGIQPDATLDRANSGPVDAAELQRRNELWRKKYRGA
jgi:hypothetical protein